MKKQEEMDEFEKLEQEGVVDLALTEKAEHEYKLNEKQQRLMEYVKANIPISGFAAVLTEELWLREILKDIDSANPFVRTRALSMLGQHMGLIGANSKKTGKKADGVEVEFGE